MEEKDYKKLYEDVVALAKDGLKDKLYLSKSAKDVTEFLFPQLKETEDEKVRRKLTRFLINFNNGYYSRPSENEIDSWIKWIDKKCEQKSNDNVEPKFKAGDWIVCSRNDSSREILYVYDIRDGRYYFNDNVHFSLSVKECDEKSHLWTIQDAKDGDVLATLGYILIFKKHLKDDGGISYCHYDFSSTNPQFIWLENKNWHFGKEVNIHPATKEQRDLLFQKMREAGYKWDDEKKELNKIEKQSEQKSQGKSALEVWKDMRSEVYQQASGNRHEPNYSDNTTKMFSIDDIDEIFEKVAENQCEQKHIERIKFTNEFENQVSHLIASVLNREYEYNGGFIKYAAKSLLEYAKKEQKDADNVEQKFKVGDIISDGNSEVGIVSIDGNKYNVTNGEIENDANICNWVIYFKDQENWKLVNKSCSEENEKQPQPKQEWSEEDENLYTWCMAGIQTRYNDGLFTTSEYSQTKLWLKSLKDRVQQPKQEWSKEDEVRLTSTIQKLEYAKSLNAYNEYGKDSIIKNIDWLKSLRPQFHWKPTDKQMEAIKYFIDFHRPQANASIEGWKEFKHLESLYNNLEKL